MIIHFQFEWPSAVFLIFCVLFLTSRLWLQPFSEFKHVWFQHNRFLRSLKPQPSEIRNEWHQQNQKGRIWLLITKITSGSSNQHDFHLFLIQRWNKFTVEWMKYNWIYLINCLLYLNNNFRELFFVIAKKSLKIIQRKSLI